MWVRFKGLIIHFISSWKYLLLFVAIFLFPSDMRTEKATMMVVLAILSLAWAISLFRRVRLIEDTLTTGLDSAAQGYVELEGKVSLYDGEVVRSLNWELPPMVWFHDYFYRDFFRGSGAGFILDDGNGRCTIDPREAEVITPRYSYNNHSYYAIYPGETIYALGQLETLKKHATEYEREGHVLSKIVEWKKDQYHFLDYFDKDNNGKIDGAEMASAKDAAQRQVDAELEYRYQQPATHVVSYPEDGRPFILSSIHPLELIERYKRAIWIHLAAWIYLSVLVLAMQAN